MYVVQTQFLVGVRTAVMRGIIHEFRESDAMKVLLFDGGSIRGARVSPDGKIAFTLKRDADSDDMLSVEAFVKALLDSGSSFIMQYGEGEGAYCLEWTHNSTNGATP